MLGNLINRLQNQGVAVNIKPQLEINLSLWTQEMHNEKSPVLKGYVYINGAKHKVVLWNNQNPNPKAPQFTGCLDIYQEQA